MDEAKKSSAAGQIWAFLVLAFLLSWPFWLASGILPRRGMGPFDFRWLIAQIGVFGPSIAALLLTGITHRNLRRSALRILPVLLLPLFLPGLITAAQAPSGVAEFGLLPSVVTVAITLAVALFFSPLNPKLLLPGTGKPQGKPTAVWILLSIVLFPGLFVLAWVLINLQGGDWAATAFQGGVAGLARILILSFSHNLLLGGSLGEEIGWRGFLLPRLLERHPPVRASLVLGVVWGLWHLPIDHTAGYLLDGPAAILVRMLTVIPLSILFTWFYLKTGGSLLIALLLHTSGNILPDFGFSQFEGAAVLLVLFIVIIAMVVSGASRVFQQKSG